MGWTVATLRQTGKDGEAEWELCRICDISDDEYRAYDEALNDLADAAEQDALNYVLDDFRSYFGALAAAPERFDKTRDVEWNPIRRIQADLQRLFSHWLQSTRSYLDQTETRLKRRYGKEAAEVVAFERATAECYDKDFAYRFLYKLRNALHCIPPALRFDIWDHALEDGTIEREVSLNFSRDELLEDFDGWGSRVRDDLEGMPAEFSAQEHMTVMMDCLEIIRDAVGQAEHESLQASLELVNQLWSMVEGCDGSLTLAYVEGGPEQPRAVQMRSVPWFSSRA